MKRAGKFFDPESREFKRFVWNTWKREISQGYRIKKAMEAKYRLKVQDKYPGLFDEELNIHKEKEIYKKICRFIEKDLYQATLKYCQLYIKEIFPLQNPALDEGGNVKKEKWCTLQLPKEKVILRMRYDLLEEGDLLTDTKCISPTICPPSITTKEPNKKNPKCSKCKKPILETNKIGACESCIVEYLIKQENYMNSQEQYMYYSMWYWRTYGVIPTNRQYTIKKNVKPLYVPLPDVKYTEANYQIIMEKIRAAKKVIESECFHGNNQSNLCSVDYCGFWPKCKYVHR
jgi:hypothetical protein